MKKIASILTVATVLMIWSSCSKDKATDTSVACTTGKTTYAQADSIISTNCTSCHGGTTSPNLSTYTNLKSNISNVLCRMNGSCGGVMPPAGQLSAAEIAVVQKWKDDGMCEN